MIGQLSSHWATETLDRLSSRVRSIKDDLDVPYPPEGVARLDSNPFSEFGAHVGGGMICVNYLLLLDVTELKPSYDTPEAFITWLENNIGTGDVRLPRRFMDKFVVRNFLKVVQDPDKEKWNRIRTFVLAHELGHIHHKHYEKWARLHRQWTGWGAIAGLLTALSGSALAYACRRRLLVCACALGAGIGNGFLVKKLGEKYHSRQHEREADAVAARKYAAEGIEGIRAIQSAYLDLRNNRSVSFFKRVLFQTLYTSKGDPRFWMFQAHPTPSERIRFFKSVLAAKNR